mmetsp:Transcript_28689/g.72033  ORF Transcript_28689/g.72033 Transcript_28689/m.72033 type:complete len:127 (+) Transcript_28689:911-1291(+)
MWIHAPQREGGLGGEVMFPLLVDEKREIARAYGVLNAKRVALRGLFVIDAKGVVRHASVNNMDIERNSEEALRVVQAVVHTSKNPEKVCPAKWRPGRETMKTDLDPEGCKEYSLNDYGPRRTSIRD